jgi:UTP--glucose-1-phosphate uridylyltransferase
MLLDATKFYRDDSVFVACREVQKRELKQYGIVKPKGQVFDDSPTRFSEVVEKPEIEEAPSHLAVIGRMLLPYKILQNTYSIFHKSKQIGIEPHIISLINSYVEQNHDGYAVVIQNECYDCGSLAGYRSACRDFSK